MKLPSDMEIKLVILKLFELAYSEDKGLVTKILQQPGSFNISVDQSGSATISSSVGIMTFKGSPALKEIGLKIKSVSISFTNGGGFNVGYVGKINFGGLLGVLSLSGSFNIEKLLMSCSGLLCIAARGMRPSPERYESELKNALGY